MVWPFESSELGKKSAEKAPGSWSESLSNGIRNPLATAKEWAPVVLVSLVGLGTLQLYANYLRRIPGAAYIRPNFFRSRSLFGRVTSVGDGDGFHLFHTPGGRATGWNWLRKVPEGRKELKDRTVRATGFIVQYLLERRVLLLMLFLLTRYRSDLQVSMRQKWLTSVGQLNHSQLRHSSGCPATSCTEM